MRRWKKWTAVCVSLALALVVLELSLRLVGYDRNPHPHWSYDARLGWRIDAHSAPFDGVNSLGFRFAQIDAKKPAATRRLLLLGDSFAVGSAVPFAQTTAAVLERLLNQSTSERWQVINLSVDDWGNAQQLIALQRIGWEFSPDMVVVELFPLNDLCNNTLELAYTCSLQDGDRPYFRLGGDPAPQGERGLLVASRLSPLRHGLRQGSCLYSWIENRLFQVTDPARHRQGAEAHLARRSFFEENARSRGLDHEGAAYALMPWDLLPEPVRNGWRVTSRILAQMKSEADARNVGLLAVSIPFSATFDPLWDEMKRQLRAPIERGAADQTLERILDEQGIPAINGRRRILEDGTPPERYFVSRDDGHLSSFGHSRVAQWIVDELKSQGWL